MLDTAASRRAGRTSANYSTCTQTGMDLIVQTNFNHREHGRPTPIRRFIGNTCSNPAAGQVQL
jgi:hypothetical protein